MDRRIVGLLSVLWAAASLAAAPDPKEPLRESASAGHDGGYHAESLRDPMKSLLPPPAPPPVSPQAGAKPAAPVIMPPAATLEGMLWGGSQPRAILNGEVYQVGDFVAGAKIVSIDRNGVTVEVSGTTFELRPVIGGPRRVARPPTTGARPAGPSGGQR